MSIGFLLFTGCGEDKRLRDRTVGAAGATGPMGVGDAGGNKRPPREHKPPSAAETVERYYELVDRGDFDDAWAMLPQPVQVKSGGFDQWRSGYAATVSSTPKNVSQTLGPSDIAVVALDLVAEDRDMCTDELVRQQFSGSWTLDRDRDDWTAVAVDMQKVGGGTPTLTESECPESEPPATTPAAPQPAVGCTPGYSACLPPDSDYDCEGGSGDGPSYTGTVGVSGSDPYGLDADFDGTGCE